MHALLIGATGATGRDLLTLLLEDNSFSRVDVFVRRQLSFQHQKLHTHVIDFDAIAEWQDFVKGDVLFSCLGTTLKAAGSKEAQWKIDYDYQYNFAKVARINNVPSMVLVSSSMASPSSLFFYSRMKGQLEVAIKELGFPQLRLFNPPTLIRKNSDRKAEKLFSNIISVFNKVGLLNNQRPLPTEVLAQAMIQAAKDNTDGCKVYEGKKIWHSAASPSLFVK